jgi:hypothetical protein
MSEVPKPEAPPFDSPEFITELCQIASSTLDSYRQELKPGPGQLADLSHPSDSRHRHAVAINTLDYANRWLDSSLTETVLPDGRKTYEMRALTLIDRLNLSGQGVTVHTWEEGEGTIKSQDFPMDREGYPDQPKSPRLLVNEAEFSEVKERLEHFFPPRTKEDQKAHDYLDRFNTRRAARIARGKHPETLLQRIFNRIDDF